MKVTMTNVNWVWLFTKSERNKQEDLGRHFGCFSSSTSDDDDEILEDSRVTQSINVKQRK